MTQTITNIQKETSSVDNKNVVTKKPKFPSTFKPAHKSTQQVKSEEKFDLVEPKIPSVSMESNMTTSIATKALQTLYKNQIEAGKHEFMAALEHKYGHIKGVSDTIAAVCSGQSLKLPDVAYEKNNHRGPAIDKFDDGTKDPSAYIAQIEAGFSKTRITKVSSKKEFYKYTQQTPPKCSFKNDTVFIPVPPSDEQVLKNTRVELIPNPKNKGTKSWHRYEAYKSATTLYEYLYAGGGGGNGDYKNDFFCGYLKILDPWWTSIPEPIKN